MIVSIVCPTCGRDVDYAQGHYHRIGNEPCRECRLPNPPPQLGKVNGCHAERDLVDQLWG